MTERGERDRKRETGERMNCETERERENELGVRLNCVFNWEVCKGKRGKLKSGQKKWGEIEIGPKKKGGNESWASKNKGEMNVGVENNIF